jgi:hypothetical protein
MPSLSSTCLKSERRGSLMNTDWWPETWEERGTACERPRAENPCFPNVHVFEEVEPNLPCTHACVKKIYKNINFDLGSRHLSTPRLPLSPSLPRSLPPSLSLSAYKARGRSPPFPSIQI